MPSIHTIMRSVRKQRIQEVYSKNNRVINPTLYHKLKQKKKCDDGDKQNGKNKRNKKNMCHLQR